MRWLRNLRIADAIGHKRQHVYRADAWVRSTVAIQINELTPRPHAKPSVPRGRARTVIWWLWSQDPAMAIRFYRLYCSWPPPAR